MSEQMVLLKKWKQQKENQLRVSSFLSPIFMYMHDISQPVQHKN